ncbi:MAG: sigma-70 family RNA polymerase sigma factor [Pyrinomonadaceae bacterium]
MESAASTGELKTEAVKARSENPSNKIADKISDHALIAATCAGDEAAFEEIVNRYRNQITNFIFRMLNDYEEAVDLAQETFVRVFQARDRYTDDYAFSTYIYRIATNLAISELRKRKRRRLISLNGFFQIDDGSQTEFQPPDKKPLQDAILADAQIQAVVSKAIATLPEKYRAPLILRDVEGKTYDEISNILATNEGTIKSRISRGRNLLREKLRNYF